MQKTLVLVLVSGLLIFSIIGMANAALIYDFEDGTTQGWSETAPFNGILGIDTTFGNPGFSMFATDTAAGGAISKSPIDN